MNEKHDSFREERFLILLIAFVLIIFLLFYCFASMFTSIGYQSSVNVKETQHREVTIIIDAGHGGEDPGAFVNGIKEKELNLAIAEKLSAYFKLSGNAVVMTRTEDELLYHEDQKANKKFYDLRNRVLLAQNYENALFISIHMNTFPGPSCNGLQTFYSENNSGSKFLAEKIQTSSKLLMPENQRTVKSDQKNIYLLRELKLPAVLIECGFLSNETDAANLSDVIYQDKLAYCLFIGICSYLEDQDIENELCLQSMR